MRAPLKTAAATWAPSLNIIIIIIESPHVKSVKTLLTDDLGSWKATGTKTSYFRTNKIQTADESHRFLVWCCWRIPLYPLILSQHE